MTKSDDQLRDELCNEHFRHLPNCDHPALESKRENYRAGWNARDKVLLERWNEMTASYENNRQAMLAKLAKQQAIIEKLRSQRDYCAAIIGPDNQQADNRIGRMNAELEQIVEGSKE